MADIVTSRVFTDGERGITAQKLNDIVASSVIQPAFYTSKPTAGTADPTDIALILKSGAYAQVPISTLGGSATQAQIWSTRLRSFNAVGNPNFEVDQRTVGAGVGLSATAPFCQDRWQAIKFGASAGVTAIPFPGSVNVPGTSFAISAGFLRCNLIQSLATLAAGDCLYLSQAIEGNTLRELRNDVHSLSILVRSSVANLQLGLGLRSGSGTIYSLCKLVSLGAANTWSVITCPNLPIWSSSATWPITPGSIGYYLTICLGSGTTYTSPANDTFQAGTFIGAVGQSNFANNPVNSTFDIAFIQHEPGPVCSTFIDKSFTQNLDECLRYYQKTYDYGTTPGAAVTPGVRAFLAYQSQAAAFGDNAFHKPMAKLPAVTFYDHGNGTINSVMDNGGVHHTGASANGVGTTGFYGVGFTTATTAIMPVYFHYTADTGW